MNRSIEPDPCSEPVPCRGCGEHHGPPECPFECATDARSLAAPPPPAEPRVTVNRDFAEGRDTALANAAMLAYDMGHPDVRRAINQLIPEESGNRPIDTPPGPRASVPFAATRLKR